MASSRAGSGGPAWRMRATSWYSAAEAGRQGLGLAPAGQGSASPSAQGSWPPNQRSQASGSAGPAGDAGQALRLRNSRAGAGRSRGRPRGALAGSTTSAPVHPEAGEHQPAGQVQAEGPGRGRAPGPKATRAGPGQGSAAGRAPPGRP